MSPNRQPSTGRRTRASRRARRRETRHGDAAAAPRAALLDAVFSPRPVDRRRRDDQVHAAIVVVLALALRVAYFLLARARNPLFDQPVMDALFHHQWALDLARGTAHVDDAYYHAPLYPWLLSLVYRAGGERIAVAVFVQHLLGTVTALLTWRLAREFLAPRVALVAGVLMALYWTAVYFEGQLLIVTLFMTLEAAALLALVRAQQTDALRPRLEAGAWLGLATIARPSILAFVPFVPLALRAAPGVSSLRGALGRFVPVLAVMLVPIAPVMVHNWTAGRAVVPVAANGGINFYIGNNPQSDGTSAILPGTRADWWGGLEDATAIAERARGRKLRVAEVSSYWFRRALAFMARQPGAALRLTLRKLRMFLGAAERSNTTFIYYFWERAGLGKVPLPGYGLVATLGLAGMIVAWPRRRRLAVPYLFAITYAAGVVAFFVNARFRLPVVPPLVIFAAAAGAYGVEAWRRRSFEVLRVVGIVAATGALVVSDLSWVRRIRPYATAFSHYTIANAWLEQGRTDDALTEYEIADRLGREHPTPNYRRIAREVDLRIGTLLAARGLCSRAIDHLERVGGDDAMAREALAALGECHLRRHDARRALETFRRLQRIAPDDVRAATGVARSLLAAGRLDEAAAILERIADPSRPAWPPAWAALARLRERRGDVDGAIDAWKRVARLAGFEKDAWTALAELYARRGQRDAAIDAVEKARPFFAPGDPTPDRMIQAIRAGALGGS